MPLAVDAVKRVNVVLETVVPVDFEIDSFLGAQILMGWRDGQSVEIDAGAFHVKEVPLD